MSVRFFLKILATIVLLDFMLLAILEKYLGKGFLKISFTVNLYSFEFSLKFTTWIFLIIFATLIFIALFLIRKIKK